MPRFTGNAGGAEAGEEQGASRQAGLRPTPDAAALCERASSYQTGKSRRHGEAEKALM